MCGIAGYLGTRLIDEQPAKACLQRMRRRGPDAAGSYRHATPDGRQFRPLDGPAEGTFRTYVGIDEKINRIHQYLKVLKFGYGRATDHACEDIRNGRLTREQAKELIRSNDLVPLSDFK